MQDNPSRVAAAVEQSLNRNATALAHVISPNTKSDSTRTPEALAELSKSVAAYRADLAATRIDITHETGKVHELYRQVLANSIRLLEQEIHGSVSRASRAKADYLAVVAEGMAKSLVFSTSSCFHKYTPMTCRRCYESDQRNCRGKTGVSVGSWTKLKKSSSNIAQAEAWRAWPTSTQRF